MTDNGSNGELHGWKAIASYLDKSVRTVQRWEHELGLPVRRLKTASGQAPFARRDEIDAWKARHELPARDLPEDLDPPRAETTVARPAGFGRRHFAALAATVVLVSAATLVGVLQSRPDTARVALVRFGDASLDALDAQGRVLWRHEIRADVRSVPYWREGSERVRILDIDGDGRREVLAVITYRDRGRSDELLCLSESGTLRWTHTPGFSLKFRAQEFGPPWNLMDLIAEPAGRELWVAVGHHAWWPSAVVRLDVEGTARIHLVHSGLVHAIGTWDIGGSRRLVATGVNNEFASASVAVLDRDGPPVSSPQTPGAPYECLGCPTAKPWRYFLLPRSEVNRASSEPYNRVFGFQVLNGVLAFSTNESPDYSGASIMYRIGADLRVAEGTPTDGYWAAHQHYEKQGLIDHSTDRCTDRTRARDVRVFGRDAGWTVHVAENAGMPPPGITQRPAAGTR